MCNTSLKIQDLPASSRPWNELSTWGQVLKACSHSGTELKQEGGGPRKEKWHKRNRDHLLLSNPVT